MRDGFVGIQVNPVGLYDEGIDHALDLMQETAGVNTLIAYTHTYYGAHNRPRDALAQDHGVPVRDERGRKLPGLWIRHHEERFRGTVLRHRPDPEGTEYTGHDILADLAEPARKRGMKVFARFLEPHQARTMRYIENWSQVLSIDVYGRLHPNTCFNNPDYQRFWMSSVEDMFKTYPIDGLQYGSERCGPLSRMLFWDDVPTCFCDHCMARARAEGINGERAREGFQKLYEYNLGLRNGTENPIDGAFPTFLRILLRYPEILAWEQMAHDSKEDLARRLYGAVKIIRPDARFGIHVDHQQSTWDLFQRAEIDYGELARYCDFVKPIAYHDIAAPRIKNWYLARAQKTLLRDTSMGLLAEAFYDLMGYDKTREPGLEEMDTRGFSEDYVYRLTRRIVDGVGGQVPVYPGIGFDVPYGDDHFGGDPETVYRAVIQAFEAGASGIMLSREYAEMRVANMRAVGRALRDLG